MTSRYSLEENLVSSDYYKDFAKTCFRWKKGNLQEYIQNLISRICRIKSERDLILYAIEWKDQALQDCEDYLEHFEKELDIARLVKEKRRGK